MVKISIIPLEVLIGIIEEMEKLIGMFGIVFKFIKNNEYVYYSLYSVLSLAIIFIFYKYIKLFEKFNDLKKIFLWYLVFFGIYGPYKKLKVKNYLIRFLISTSILVIISIGDKL
ncbi:hypothetical protein [Leptotrichia wadei]|nr:hypothetical protein [Leptotrichia wadei]